ncbi:hypothetical protein M405DRAFT_407422 [Rhizopogon salebrosus TDB-379]|nr:hypothetical protein M405DRAFT_407422 [Rhizopogon salebrosus TDB-379]
MHFSACFIFPPRSSTTLSEALTAFVIAIRVCLSLSIRTSTTLNCELRSFHYFISHRVHNIFPADERVLLISLSVRMIAVVRNLCYHGHRSHLENVSSFQATCNTCFQGICDTYTRNNFSHYREVILKATAISCALTEDWLYPRTSCFRGLLKLCLTLFREGQVYASISHRGRR